MHVQPEMESLAAAELELAGHDVQVDAPASEYVSATIARRQRTLCSRAITARAHRMHTMWQRVRQHTVLLTFRPL